MRVLHEIAVALHITISLAPATFVLRYHFDPPVLAYGAEVGLGKL